MNAKLSAQLAVLPGATTATDVDLVFAAQSGDHTAFGELWKRHSKRMLTMIMRITRNYEDAEDALQDSFLRIWLHLTEFRGKSKFSSWMTSIAINSALMSLRKRRSRPAFPSDYSSSDLPSDYREPESPAPNAEIELIRREQSQNLGRAIAGLRSPLRGVVEIHLAQDAGVVQVASAAGISLSAAKSRLMRAKNELRRSLNRRGQL